MTTPDLLVLAGLAAETLEDQGFVACGRREGGVTIVDFWTRTGTHHRLPLAGSERTPDEIVAACLAVARPE